MQKSSKAPPAIDASATKQDDFEKRKVMVEQLTNHWRCDVHSLPDKPTPCWKPVDQRPHGVCYLITLANLNYWASCIVSYFILSLLNIISKLF